MYEKLSAEKAVICMMLGNSEAALRILVELTSDMFSDPTSSLVFKAAGKLTTGGADLNQATLKSQLVDLKADNVINLADFPPDVVYTESKLRSLIDIVKTAYRVRQKVNAAENIISESKKLVDPQKFLSEADNLFWATTAANNAEMGIVSSGSMLEARRKTMRERASTIPLMTGFADLDAFLVGGCFAKGQVSVIAGRPAMGKSLTKANLIYNLCTSGVGVVNIANEQPLSTEMDRIDTLITGISLYDLKNSRTWTADDPRIEQVRAAQRLIDEHWNYHIIHRRGLTLQDCFLRLQQIQNRRPVNVVFFDLFDKLVDVNVAQNKPQTVGKKLGEASVMAEALGVHLCLLVQINREVDKRKDRRPTLADLKDSGTYEEVARQVLLLYRDSYYNPDNFQDILEIHVAKQNDGPVNDKVEFELQPNLGRMLPLNTLQHVYRESGGQSQNVIPQRN